MDDRLLAEVDRIRAGRDLNPFDQSVVETVASLTLRAADARDAWINEGSVIDDGKGFPIPHPALEIEKAASAELRGWVKSRPDLFGEQKAQTRTRSRPDFKVV